MNGVNDDLTLADDGLSVGTSTLSSHPVNQTTLVSIVLPDRNNQYEILHPLPVVVTMADQTQGGYEYSVPVTSIPAGSPNHVL